MNAFVTVDGRALEYRRLDARTDAAPTIIFLHEGLGSISQWRDFPDALCERTGYAGLVYNRQGYGASDALDSLPVDFMHHEAFEILPKLFAALKITKPILFGHSDGGSIALLAAATVTPPPAAIVVEAPHVFVEDLTVGSIAKLRDAYHGPTHLRARLERHHGVSVDRLFDAWTRTWLSAEFRRWNIEAYLPKITCPTLVIQGADDQYGTLTQVDAIVGAAGAPVVTMVLDGCAHAPHAERRDVVLDAVAGFLREYLK